MTLEPSAYLPDRPRPAWFGLALSTLFLALIVTALFGAFRKPGEEPPTFENRQVAQAPQWPQTRAALSDYPARFERFFDDRFGLRAALVKLDHFAKAVVFGVSPVSKVLIGKSGWLYFKGEDSKALDRWYRGIDPLSDSQIVALREELLKRNAFLDSRGIAFLVVIVPEKYSVYPEFLPEWATASKDGTTSLDRIAADLAKYPELHFIDLRAPLQVAKGRERVYYQTDSHWNYLGAMVGYTEVMDEAMRLVPGLSMAPAVRPPYVAGVEYYGGDLAQMLGLPKELQEDDIAPLGKILATPQTRCAQLEITAETDLEIYVNRCADASRYTALVYRDSNAIPLIPMLAENFARSTFVSSAQINPALVDRLKPDIVIEEMVQRSLASPAALPMR